MSVPDSTSSHRGYAPINGLEMYYEVHGAGKPLVLLHGGGSTINTTFGKIIPLLAGNHQVIAVELQAHGRTSDRDAELSFEQDAADVAGLLRVLKIEKADFLGFSNGGTTLIHLALEYPDLVDKIILASALAKRSGVPAFFWDFMEQAKLENMPPQLKEAFLAVNPDPKALEIMHDKDARRMREFRDIPDDRLRSIKGPVLIVIGDRDIITPEHALELHRLLANSSLAIIPGQHGEYLGEITTLDENYSDEYLIVPIIEKFLNRSWQTSSWLPIRPV